MPLWPTTITTITIITTKQKIDILLTNLPPWTSEAKTHGKAKKHLKVNLDFIISWEKKEKRGRGRGRLVCPKVACSDV